MPELNPPQKSERVKEIGKEIEQLLKDRFKDDAFLFTLSGIEEKHDNAMRVGYVVITNLDENKVPFAIFKAIVSGQINATNHIMSRYDPTKINQEEK